MRAGADAGERFVDDVAESDGLAFARDRSAPAVPPDPVRGPLLADDDAGIRLGAETVIKSLLEPPEDPEAHQEETIRVLLRFEERLRRSSAAIFDVHVPGRIGDSAHRERGLRVPPPACGISGAQRAGESGPLRPHLEDLVIGH